MWRFLSKKFRDDLQEGSYKYAVTINLIGRLVYGSESRYRHSHGHIPLKDGRDFTNCFLLHVFSVFHHCNIVLNTTMFIRCTFIMAYSTVT